MWQICLKMHEFKWNGLHSASWKTIFAQFLLLLLLMVMVREEEQQLVQAGSFCARPTVDQYRKQYSKV